MFNIAVPQNALFIPVRPFSRGFEVAFLPACRKAGFFFPQKKKRKKDTTNKFIAFNAR
jgi:hypothetical protein